MSMYSLIITLTRSIAHHIWDEMYCFVTLHTLHKRCESKNVAGLFRFVGILFVFIILLFTFSLFSTSLLPKFFQLGAYLHLQGEMRYLFTGCMSFFLFFRYLYIICILEPLYIKAKWMQEQTYIQIMQNKYIHYAFLQYFECTN